MQGQRQTEISAPRGALQHRDHAQVFSRLTAWGSSLQKNLFCSGQNQEVAVERSILYSHTP